MRSRGGSGLDFEARLDKAIYRSVTSMLLLGNIRRNPLMNSGVPEMRNRLLFSLLPLVLAACSPSNGSEKGGKGPGGFPPAEVNAVTVAPATLPVTFEYVGQTAGSREVEVRARVTGILKSRNFVEGAAVAKGQSMFTIDPAPYEAALARAEADVGAAEA